MASDSNLSERSYRRTVSACSSSIGSTEVRTIGSRQRLRSEDRTNLLSIEEIVTCSIHLGIMENPRKLHCQHAFCNDCLIRLVRANEILSCPVCRNVENSTDVTSLPYALVESQLIEIVMQRRMNVCSSSNSLETVISKESKEELVKHLLKELKQSTSHLFKCNDIEELGTNVVDTCIDTRIPRQTSVSSSTYDLMDIETIRENMLNNSWYEDSKHCIKKIGRNSATKKLCRTQTTFTTFDIHNSTRNSDIYEIVFVDTNTHKLFVYSINEIRSFLIYVDGLQFNPAYIRVLRDDIFVTGSTAIRGTTFALFVQTNMYGKVIRKSELFPSTHPELTIPVLCGFDVDEKNEKYFVCNPHSNLIHVFNTSLIDSRQNYEFDSNKPEFVTFDHHHNQLWVSCPKSHRILIADVDTGAFMMFCTDQINDSIPNMIRCTDDERIIFLDSRSNRFIWIKRRGDYILTQKLHFRSINGEMHTKTFQVLPSAQIVVGTATEFLVFQPVKLKSKLKSGITSCALL